MGTVLFFSLAAGWLQPSEEVKGREKKGTDGGVVDVKIA